MGSLQPWLIPRLFSDFCVQRKERLKEIKAKFLMTMKVAWRKQTANSEPRPVWRTSRHAHGVCFGILQISPIRAHFPNWEAMLPGNRAALPGPRPASQTWCSVSAASSSPELGSQPWSVYDTEKPFSFSGLSGMLGTCDRRMRTC